MRLEGLDVLGSRPIASVSRLIRTLGPKVCQQKARLCPLCLLDSLGDTLAFRAAVSGHRLYQSAVYLSAVYAVYRRHRCYGDRRSR